MKKAKAKRPVTIEPLFNISHCSFDSRVMYDAPTLAAVVKVADGLVENARALRALADVLAGGHVTSIGVNLSPTVKP